MYERLLEYADVGVCSTFCLDTKSGAKKSRQKANAPLLFAMPTHKFDNYTF